MMGAARASLVRGGSRNRGDSRREL